MRTKRLFTQIHDHVAVVTLDRQDKLNALDLDMFHAIIEAGETLAENANVRAVVLTGAGRAFCAGIDLATFAVHPELAAQPLSERTHGIANMWQQAVWVWRSLPVPVVAAVHGVAFGGGLQIMLGADIKFIAPDTKVSIMEVKWGIIPDMAGTQLMRHTVRDDIIRELTYTHRVFSGTEAVDYGFATHVSEQPLEDATKLAKEIASKSPSAIVKAKKVLNAAPYLDMEAGLRMESEEQDTIIRKPNQMEAVYASMQKRAGSFENHRDS